MQRFRTCMKKVRCLLLTSALLHNAGVLLLYAEGNGSTIVSLTIQAQ